MYLIYNPYASIPSGQGVPKTRNSEDDLRTFNSILERIKGLSI